MQSSILPLCFVCNAPITGVAYFVLHKKEGTVPVHPICIYAPIFDTNVFIKTDMETQNEKQRER